MTYDTLKTFLKLRRCLVMVVFNKLLFSRYNLLSSQLPNVLQFEDAINVQFFIGFCLVLMKI